MNRLLLAAIVVFWLKTGPVLQGWPASASQVLAQSSEPVSVEALAAKQSSETQFSVDPPVNRIIWSGPVVEAFEPFSPSVKAVAEGKFMIVECDGLPEHDMMIGIKSWQQQVPLPQPYTGRNAWRLPLNPQFAEKPISVLEEPIRGAIALAVNGVPIFPALNNRGDDTYLAGELDHWGGHCGRGDDYHYHRAPVHLEEAVGKGKPIAYALDGFPILGRLEADGRTPTKLDEFHGHRDSQGNYHYHASDRFPYINGGLRGVVTMRGDQIEQPRDSPARPGQSPLRGATVTGFHRAGDDFEVEYEVGGKALFVKYTILDDQRVQFSYVNAIGESTTRVYRRGQQSRRPGNTILWAALAVMAAFCLALLVRRSLSRRRAS